MRIKDQLIAQLKLPVDEIDLATANLLLAQYLSAPFKSSTYLNQLKAISAQVEAQIRPDTRGQEKLNVLNHILFEDKHLRGNSDDYYNPENSFLNRVFDLGLGIPISLSVIYLDIGWRLGFPLAGIGLPGHFIVAYQQTETAIYVDPFNGGRFLSEDDCMDMCQVPEADRVPFRAEYLQPVSRADILYRMLLNLKQIYLSRESWDEAYKVVDLMLVIKPGELTGVRDRGLIAYRLKRYQNAINDIQHYLALAPHSPDAGWLKRYLNTLEKNLLRLN